jgi:streptomycin 3"-adenylyltransferase
MDCPTAVHAQVTAVVDESRAVLGSDLVGVYQHGSLAMGCFNPAGSDVDLLVVAARPPSVDKKRRLVEMLLGVSGRPSPVELSVLLRSDLAAWSHPLPYELHFSEGWRARLAADLASGEWRRWSESTRSRRDPDLAAHVTVVRARGVCLIGEPIPEVFPEVPRADYLDSILADLAWSREPARLAASPVYAVLNHCRVLRYLMDGAVTSKAEAGEWASGALAPNLRGAAAAALAIYRSTAPGGELAPDTVARFVESITREIDNRR